MLHAPHTLGYRFIVDKEKERSEVKVQEGPDGFPFLKNEKYIFKYSFRAVDDMKVSAPSSLKKCVRRPSLPKR